MLPQVNRPRCHAGIAAYNSLKQIYLIFFSFSFFCDISTKYEHNTIYTCAGVSGIYFIFPLFYFVVFFLLLFSFIVLTILPRTKNGF